MKKNALTGALNGHNIEKGFTGLLVTVCIYTTFFAAYLGSSFYGYGFALLLIMFRLHRLRLTPLQLVAIALLITYAVIALMNARSAAVILQNIRFWHGFAIFLLFFKVCDDSRLASPRFFYIVCAAVILEAILVNTIINPELIYRIASKSDFVRYFGFYQRPLSFAGNASMSSGALIVLYALVEKLNPGKLRFRDLGLLLGCVIIFMSATGFLLFLVMLLLRAFRAKITSWRGMMTWAMSLAAIVGAYYVSVSIQVIDFQKGSFAYIQALYENKIIGLLTATMADRSWFDILFGLQIYSVIPNTSGDFGWLNIFLTCGVVGVGIYTLLVYAFYRPRVNLLPVLILLFLGVVHYPVAMSQAGQLLLAFILVGARPGKTNSHKKIDSIVGSQ